MAFGLIDDKVVSSEVSKQFIDGMTNRMVVSFYKYGPVKVGAPKMDAISSARNCMRKYAETGNTEYLMDAANYMMIEFMFPKRDGAFFKATDDSGSAGRVAAATGSLDKRANDELGERPSINLNR